MRHIGKISGYCSLWGEISHDLSNGNGEPAYDQIRKDSIMFARDVRANYHHIRQACFASTGNASLQIGTDEVGVWFDASIPDDRYGYDILNGLGGGRWLSVSAELIDVSKHYDADSGSHIVCTAILSGLAIVQRHTGLFAGTRAWLNGDVPNERQAAALHASFAARKRRRAEPVAIPPMPQAMKKAMAMMGRR
jgi:Caudovirus prohead serine protease